MGSMSKRNCGCQEAPLSLKQVRMAERSLAPGDRAGRLALARRALALGENFYACDLAEALPDSAEKLQVLGVALARSGALRRAGEIAEQLRDDRSSECAGFRSRMLKDMAVAAADSAEKRRLFREAAEISLSAFREHGEYFNGVNAACCLLLGGDPGEARRIAGQAFPPDSDDSLWADATRGECLLIAGRREEAQRCYREASRRAAGRFGDFGSTVRQLRLLLTHLDGDDRALPEFVELPGIALLAGRNEPVAVFPSGEREARRQADAFLRRNRVAIACLSGPGGEDVLFAEAALDHGAECLLILSGDAPARNPRLAAVCAHDRATTIHPECQKTGEGDAVVEEFHDCYALGMALLKRRQLAFPLFCAWFENGLPRPETVETWNRYAVRTEGIPC